jgi:hypothetical protein
VLAVAEVDSLKTAAEVLVALVVEASVVLVVQTVVLVVQEL